MIDCQEELSNETNDGTQYLESELDVQIDKFCNTYNAESEGARHTVTERHDYAVRGRCSEVHHRYKRPVFAPEN